MKRQARLFYLIAGSLLLLGIGGFSGAHEGAHGGANADVRQSEAQYHGGVVTPPLPKPRFILTDTSGTPFDFQLRTNGYVTLLFFGYTSCPDVCPMHMSILSSAIKKLPKDLAAQFRVVFVTTDPERDNPQELRKWLDAFSNTIVGLTGTKAEIQAAQSAADLPFARQGVPNYDHAAFVVAYTKDNLAHVIYPSGISENDWLHDLPRLARETWKSR